MKRFLIAVLVGLGLVACQPAPVQVHKSGQPTQVQFVVHNRGHVSATFPESRYIARPTTFFIEQDDLVNLDNPDWWENFHKFMVHEYWFERQRWVSANGKIDPIDPDILEVPATEWMKENVQRASAPYLILHIELPIDGRMMIVTDKDSYLSYIKNNHGTAQDLAPMQITIDGQETIHSTRQIYITDGEEDFAWSLDYFQEKVGQLMYRYADGRYLLITLPPELMKLKPEDMEIAADRSFVVSTEILK